MNTENNTNSAVVPLKTRGRKKISFSFPTGEFKVKDIAKERGVSVAFVFTKIKEAGGRIVKTRTEGRIEGKKGKPACYFQYVSGELAEEVVPAFSICE